MAITSTQTAGAEPGWKRWRATGLCLAMFAIFVELDRTASSVIAPWINRLAMPAGGNPAWWYVLQRIMVTGSADVLAAFIPVTAYLWLTGQRLRDLGFTRPGTLRAWVLVLAVEGLLLWFDVTKGPVGRVADPLEVYALVASAIVGLCAPLAEETFFRGFLMNELARSGVGVPQQVLASAVLFGAAHYGYHDWPMAVMTGALGGFWAIVYVLARRSLWPTLVAHGINAVVVIPSVFFLILHAAGH